jgi:hypothetical protein
MDHGLQHAAQCPSVIAPCWLRQIVERTPPEKCVFARTSEVSRMFRRLMALLAGLLMVASPVWADGVLKAEKVGEGVYAMVGPIGGRLPGNLGLNANFGVIDTPQGAILIDSGPSFEAARLLEAEVKKLTGYPYRPGQV